MVNTPFSLFSLLIFKKLLVRFDCVEYLIRFPLSPHKVVVTPLLKIAHGPPKSCFQSSSNQNRIISFADVVLIRWKTCCWKRYIVVIRFVYFYQECTIVSFFQIEVLLFVFRISKVFCEGENLTCQAFQAVVSQLRTFLFKIVNFWFSESIHVLVVLLKHSQLTLRSTDPISILSWL